MQVSSKRVKFDQKGFHQEVSSKVPLRVSLGISSYFYQNGFTKVLSKGSAEVYTVGFTKDFIRGFIKGFYQEFHQGVLSKGFTRFLSGGFIKGFH